MTRRVYRYQVPVDDQPHTFKVAGMPLRVAASGDARTVEFWIEDDDQFPAVTRRAFQVFGTGQPLPDIAKWRGTCERHPLGLVWHLYEVEP